MSISIKKVPLPEQHSECGALNNPSNYSSLINNLEVHCSIRVGTLKLTIGQLKELKLGQALTLEQQTNEPVELLLNDKVIARGELMSHEQQFAVQITEVCS